MTNYIRWMEPYHKQCQELNRLYRLAHGDEAWSKEYFGGFAYIPVWGRFFCLCIERHDEIPGNAYELIPEPMHWTDYRTAKRELLAELSALRKGKKLPVQPTKMIRVRRRR